MGFGNLGNVADPVWVLPFAVFVVLVAFFAVWCDIRHTFWHKWNWWEELTWPKVLLGAVCFAPVAFWATKFHMWHDVMEEMQGYVAFMAVMLPFMLAAYSLSLQVNLRPTPFNNALVFGLCGVAGAFVGPVVATLVGTMILLKMNAGRERVMHIWLFVLAGVSNVPGCFLPVSSPLVMGMQAKGGISFGWYLENMAVPWMTLQGIVIFGFWLVDSVRYAGESEAVKAGDGNGTGEVLPLVQGYGKLNILVLLVMVGAVIAPLPVQQHDEWWSRSLILFTLAGVAARVPGAARARKANNFQWGPFKEVAVIFLGIFALLGPCFVVLKAVAPSLGLTTETQFFICTGVGSAWLDNAPMYVLGLTTAGTVHAGPEGPLTPAQLAAAYPAKVIALSLGAALGGIGTYIGAGQNLAARGIITSGGRKMPNFLMYVPLSLLVALPFVYLPAWLLFVAKY